MFQAEETASAKAQRLFELKEVTLWKGNDGPRGTGHPQQRAQWNQAHQVPLYDLSGPPFPHLCMTQ